MTALASAADSASRAGAGDQRQATPPRRRWTSLPVLIGGCVALAALSLLLPSSPTYDPWAWIIWGREVTELDLNTREGPSWKPLPVLFTTPFALTGEDVAPKLWLLVGRAGALLALALCFRLATQLIASRGGRIAAGAIAAAGLLLEDEYVRNGGRANSEGLLVALCLLGIDRHLDGRRDQAFLCGVGAALLRPETWPFVALYGLYCWRTDAATRKLIVGAALLVPALWFLPEWWGSGDPLRASERARSPLPTSAAFADRPFFEVFDRSSELLAPTLLVLAIPGLLLGRPRQIVLALGAAAVALMVVVAGMTEAGYSGNLRYVQLPAALVCVLAGVGAVEFVAWARRRSGHVAVAIALALVLAGLSARDVGRYGEMMLDDLDKIDYEAERNADMERAIARAGGPARVRACGRAYTSQFEVQTLAWLLHVHGQRINLSPQGYGIVFVTRLYDEPRLDRRRYPERLPTRHFVVYRSCAG